VDRFRATASKARQAQSRLKAIEKMDIVDAVIAERVTAFRFPDPEELPPPLITLDYVDVGYEKHTPILKKLNLRIDMDDRIALLGANGNGKSTLVKLLSDRLKPLAGEVLRSGQIRIGYFAQHQTDELDVTQTPYEVMFSAMVDKPEPKVRALLGQFGFDRHKADTKVELLSGGEKSRLLLCLMSHSAPHIMLLDEPANHLDMDSREALIQALNNYNGAIILVSHDPHLVECVADRLWLVADGNCKNFDGDLEEYKHLVMRQRRKERSDARNAGKVKKTDDNNGGNKEVKKLEKAVEEITQKRDQLENEIAVLVQDGKGHQLKDMNILLKQLNEQLEAAETAWLDAQEKLEAS
jgi:ATP-binding cassette subfamily F protein 3